MSFFSKQNALLYLHIFGLILPCLVIYGWIQGNVTIIRLHPTLPAMVFNTALCFVMVSSGMIAFHFNRRMLTILSGTVPLVIGLLTLIEYFGYINFHIDEFFFTDFVQSNENHPGRMSISTAIGFVILGSMLVILPFIQYVPQIAVVVVVVAGITLFFPLNAFVEYADISERSNIWFLWDTMALHTAFLFALFLVSVSVAVKNKYFLKLNMKQATLPISLCMIGLLFDAHTSSSVASTISYIPLVFSGLLFRRWIWVFIFMILATVLSAIGFFVQFEGTGWLLTDIVDRLAVLIGVWITGFLIFLVKKRETELKAAKSFQDLIMQNIPDLLFVKDNQFYIRDANPAFLDVYPEDIRDEVIGTTSIEGYDPEEAEEFLKHDKTALETGFSEVEETIDFPDGNTRTLFTKKVRFEDQNGQPFILGVARDITEIKKAQREIEQQKDMLELAEQSANLGHWHVNLLKNTVYWSDQIYTIHGVTKDEYSPELESAIKFYHPDDRDSVKDAVDKAVTNKEPFNFELRLVSRKGNTIYVQSAGHPEYNKEGNVIGLFGIFQDITEHKKAEEEILRSNKELDDFAYIASHDLKEPLRGIHNHIRLLKEDYGGALDDDGQHKINRVMYLTQRMEKLINDLLYYSRLGRSEGKHEPTDLNGIVSDIQNMMADYDDVTIIINETLPTILCDKIHVTELYRNLITNGIKYNESDEKRIEIGIKNDKISDSSHDIILYVKDNGIGIDPKFHSDIFKIFKRLHKKDAYGGGTGSGLTFVKKIIEKHGGDIRIESSLGKGTIFYFTLPEQKK